MSVPVIETHALSYRFGTHQVLDNLSLAVPYGSIYGFLGANGAGKTTTIKLLLNLLQSPERNIHLFGKELSRHRIEILSQTGSLVEQPAIYAHLTGRENLAIRARLLGLKRKRIDEILAITRLSSAADKKAGQYSLGMKQRLGIGLALLPDPELLILDEPTNGLDPAGIIEVRNFLAGLARDQQKTIFLSSHMLGEIEKIATHVGILNRGKLAFQGSIAELKKLSHEQVLIDANDIVNAANTLLKGGHEADIIEQQLVVPFISNDQMASMNKLLVDTGHSVYGIRRAQENLEDLFLHLTRNN